MSRPKPVKGTPYNLMPPDYDALKDAVLAYLSECDNPVPDYTMRKILRDRLRKLVGAPPQRPT